MGAYIARRLGYSIITLIGVATILFFLLQATGDPALVYLPQRASAADVEAFREAHGFNDPILVQYARFITNFLTGDFGESLNFGRPALGLVMEFVPATVSLALAATIIAVVVGVPLGILAAVKRGTAADTLLMTGALTGLSIPDFWLGLMLILVFGVELGWFPISGRGGLDHLILPAVTIGVAMAGSLARLLRSNLIDALGQDYIRTARAMGIRWSKIVAKHALKNASLPSLTSFALQVALILTGVFVVEVVFAYPGMGRLVINAINQRDFAVVQTGIFLAGVAYVLLNLVVDVVYTYLDPRIRLVAD
ncbi:MAG: ABC transporter permease [Actinobacteria bacterium]|nr:ABC transporter permease [Actinomycetota bacterium]MCI0679700.1 ABC transporter permease [Actinomycetota bacterium]